MGKKLLMPDTFVTNVADLLELLGYFSDGEDKYHFSPEIIARMDTIWDDLEQKLAAFDRRAEFQKKRQDYRLNRQQ